MRRQGVKTPAEVNLTKALNPHNKVAQASSIGFGQQKRRNSRDAWSRTFNQQENRKFCMVGTKVEKK